MKKKETQKINIWDLWKSWFVLLIWMLIILLFVQTMGIIIHEGGHYLVGKSYGCESLKINIARFSFNDSLSNVSGWETCKFPLVMNKDGSRVCDYQTNIDSSAGLILSLLILIPLLIFVNTTFKNKIKRFYLRKEHLVLMIIFVVVMAIKSASIDLFKIGECLFNTQTGDMIFRMINLLPTLMIIPIALLFLFDFVRIMKLIDFNKQKPKKEVS